MQSRASTQHDPMRSFRVEQVQETPDRLSTPLCVCVCVCLIVSMIKAARFGL